MTRPARRAHPLRAAAAAILLLLLLLLPSALPAAEVSLAREPEIGLAIDKLDAAGCLPALPSGARPYPLRAVRVAVGEALRSGDLPSDGFDRALAEWLDWYLAPRTDAALGAGFSATEHGGPAPLSDGVPVPGGGSLSGTASLRSEPAPWLSLQGSGAAFLAGGGERGTRLLDSSVEAGWGAFSVEAGKISTAYGPGRDGGLVFTNDAAPYPGVRIRNAEPIRAPWPLSFLGTLRYDLFVARLEDDRPIPHPLLSGRRLSARPGRFLEVGVSRAMIYGGAGRPSGLSAWWDAFQGTHENEAGGNGNQVGGFDVAANLPFRLQPVRLYLEAAGEDEAKIIGTPIPGPTKWAFLGGVFLPSIAGSSRADLRLEWAANHLKGNGPDWYVHAASGEGYAYRYRGRILGDPMGTDARRLGLTGHWFFLPSTYAELGLRTRTRYSAGGPGGAPETTVSTTAAFAGWLTPSLRAEARAGWDRLKNADGVPAARRDDWSLSAGLSWRVASGGR